MFWSWKKSDTFSLIQVDRRLHLWNHNHTFVFELRMCKNYDCNVWFGLILIQCSVDINTKCTDCNTSLFTANTFNDINRRISDACKCFITNSWTNILSQSATLLPLWVLSELRTNDLGIIQDSVCSFQCCSYKVTGKWWFLNNILKFMVHGENTWKSRKSKSLSQLSQQIKEADPNVGGRRLTRQEEGEMEFDYCLSLSLMNVNSQANCGLQITNRKSIKSSSPQWQRMQINHPPGIRNAANVHAANFVPSAGSSEEHVCHVQLSLRVLKLCSLRQVELPSSLHGPWNCRTIPHPDAWYPRRASRRRACLWFWKEGVRGLRRQEGELGSYAAGAGGAAEQAAQLAEREAIHPSLCRRMTKGPLCH